jgi:hypothetical protein
MLSSIVPYAIKRRCFANKITITVTHLNSVRNGTSVKFPGLMGGSALVSIHAADARGPDFALAVPSRSTYYVPCVAAGLLDEAPMSTWLSRMLAAARLLLVLILASAASAAPPTPVLVRPSASTIGAKPAVSALEAPRSLKSSPRPAPQPLPPPDPAPPPDEPPPTGPDEFEQGFIGEAYVSDELTLVNNDAPRKTAANAAQVAVSDCPCYPNQATDSPPRMLSAALSRTLVRCLSIVPLGRLRH